MNRIHWLGSVLLVVFICGSCEEDPGCLDVQATNYEVDAEDPCADCCTYPAFRLSVRHRWADVDTTFSFSTDTSVFSTGDQNLRFDGVHFYVSGLRLVSADGSSLNVVEDIEVTLGQGADSMRVSISQDVFLVEAGSFPTLSSGTYRGEGQFELIQFELGVPEEALPGSPEVFPNGFPLATQSPNMYDETKGYRSLRISVYPNLRDSLARVFSAFSSDVLPTITLPVAFQLDRGNFTDISLAINYRLWFEGLDWKNATDEQVKSHLLERIPGSLEVISITSSSG